MSEINVTPLVDVMLVLLIISMVAAPMLERGINLELPETANAGEIGEARVVVSLDRDGRIRYNNRRITEEILIEQMEGIAASTPNETVYLRADKLLPYGEVLRIMDNIRTAGVTTVSLVTIQLDIPGEG